MSHTPTTTPPTHAQPTDRTRDCERCGDARPANPERFTITASDYSDATAAYDKVFLCRDCWERARDQLRRCFA